MMSALVPPLYDDFLRSPAARQWGAIGARRRAGTAAPLFSVYSRRSVGLGEAPDLPLLADWCRATGQSVVQLLPLNDVGADPAPYSAQSSFALDPMYLSLRELSGADLSPFAGALKELARRFPAGRRRVDYGVKPAKLELLREIFDASSTEDVPAFSRFRRENAPWLRDYALYKALKERFRQRPWEDWDAPFKRRDPAALAAFSEGNGDVLFHEWIQWQLFAQFTAARRACAERGVLLMGDLPFLTARDSADVWARQDHFKLHLSAGAPPDMYAEKGQRWGMPPYDWERIAADGHQDLIRKLRCAETLYDLYRVDHVIGAFRIFTIPMEAPAETVALNGRFDPPEESLWEEQGRRILKVMLEGARMLPCGEDLGVVPPCAVKTLADFAVPGLDVQRWTRLWKTTRAFTPPADCRRNAVSALSTHDTSVFAEWWGKEAVADERVLFLDFLGLPAGAPEDLVLRRALERSGESAAVFSLQLLQDWLALGGLLPGDPSSWRVNVPGTVGPRNWSCVAPFSLEEMNALPVNADILDINRRSGRG